MMKFIASSADAAKAKAKRALGDGVTIVSVRNLPSGDYEVSATDGPAPSVPPQRVEPHFGEHTRQVFDEASRRGGQLSPGSRLNEPLEHKFGQDALQKLSNDLSGRPSSAGVDLSNSTARAMADALRPNSFSDALIADIVEGARKSEIDDDLRRMEVGFNEAFDFAPIHFTPLCPIMLVGPTGAGKTSCGAKLAATALNSGSTAFIMSADVGRAGAIDQIKAYGDALGADYYITETPQDVDAALRSKRPTGAVILDTPGISPYDAGDFAALKSFQQATGGEAVLVLPASGDVEEFKDWVSAFAEFGARRIILTKLDATRRIGAGLSAAHAGKLSLAHFSQTPFISDGLIDASPEFLARRMLAGQAIRL